MSLVLKDEQEVDILDFYHLRFYSGMDTKNTATYNPHFVKVDWEKEPFMTSYLYKVDKEYVVNTLLEMAN